MMTCTFFGHKDATQKVEHALKKEIIRLIIQESVDRFYVGNNGNFDSMALKLLIELSKEYAIEYYVVLAYIPTQQHYLEKENPPDTLLPDGIENTPPRFAIDYRNKWMIKKSNFVITYVNRSWGGAYKFEKIAAQKNKVVIELA